MWVVEEGAHTYIGTCRDTEHEERHRLGEILFRCAARRWRTPLRHASKKGFWREKND